MINDFCLRLWQIHKEGVALLRARVSKVIQTGSESNYKKLGVTSIEFFAFQGILLWRSGVVAKT